MSKPLHITLLTPPERDGLQPAERTAGCTRVVYPMPNIYLLTVAAVAERAGCTVACADFSDTRHGDDALQAFLASDTSDIYFFWTVNLSLETDCRAVELAGRLRPEALSVMMGPGATYFASRCLQGTAPVVVVRGEPEATVAELIERVAAGQDWSRLRGISLRDPASAQPRHNPSRPLIDDLDSLPLPARHLLGSRQYHNPKLKLSPYTTAVTSRNCPYQCIYCVPSSLTFAREIEYRNGHGHKPPIGFRSVESVESEMALLHSQGYKAIGFVDDNFIWNEQRTAALCAVMRRYGMVWGCQARVDAITESIASELGRSGCRYVDLGVESFNDDILRFIKKGITSAQIYEAIALLKKHHVPVKLNVLIGSSPLETEQTVRHTMREAKRLGVDQVMFNIVSPFPGTEFYKMCKEHGWLDTPDYVPTDVQRESILRYPHLSAADMERLLFRSNLSYFLRPGYALRQLSRFRSLAELRSALKGIRLKLFGTGRRH